VRNYSNEKLFGAFLVLAAMFFRQALLRRKHRFL